MVLDPQTRRNLELFEGGRWGDPGTSLLSVLDRTRTPMGGRLLRAWLGQPLLDIEEIDRRQEAVAWSHRSALRRARVASLLELVSDVERLVNRVRGYTATPRDLVGLAHSLKVAPQLRAVLKEDEDASQVAWLAGEIGDHEDVVGLVEAAIDDDPPLSVGDGRVVRAGFSSDLDALRNSSRDAQEYIAGLERTERERTGIKSLKVGYNKVFGYYIEVSKSNLSKVPEEYIRRQTLVGGERYITPEMKEYETLILNAQERVGELETTLFRQVCQQVAEVASSVAVTARAMAQVDVFFSLGDVAAQHGYVRPEMGDGDVLEIKQGRHAVVERMLPPGAFVPNDVRLSGSDEQLIVLTGPNMAGKSTFIRQVAIITLMAQIGSFVPAESASIGVVDRIFTRVGLQDDLAVGQSTFMVEMVETAAILSHATHRSLVVLDEIGRGTSTYDGLAIARAVAEYIHSHPRLGCKTLFATHYHELTQARRLPPARQELQRGGLGGPRRGRVPQAHRPWRGGQKLWRARGAACRASGSGDQPGVGGARRSGGRRRRPAPAVSGGARRREPGRAGAAAAAHGQHPGRAGEPADTRHSLHDAAGGHQQALRAAGAGPAPGALAPACRSSCSHCPRPPTLRC